MPSRKGLLALGLAAVGAGAGLAAQHQMVQRRRRNDPEASEQFGERRGIRSRRLERPDGAGVFIEEAGPPGARGAVFIHGSALRTDMWHYQLPGIGDHRLVFYDLRGHGRSVPKGDADFSIEVLAADLEAVIEESGLEEVVLVGHSVGGAVAMELCRRRPDLMGSVVCGLVLVTTSYRPLAETTGGGAAIAQLDRWIRRPLEMMGPGSRYVDRLRKIVRPSDALFIAVSMIGFGPAASAKQIDFTYDMLADTPSDVIFDLIKSYRDFDMRDYLDEIRLPVLVVGGSKDHITAPQASEYLAAHLPKAELRLLEGAGHMLMMERHREFNTMLERFFDDQLGAGGPHGQ
ncbi:MAG TPA: alpha/beta hydrolase [Actinomycetota bacterium]|nr:alpha/beta hydrolase [Actinomycetota bacterium]